MLLRVENLKVHFKTDMSVVKAVDGVDLSVDTGERFTLIGESGSGKSVLGLSILRLLPKNATISGRIVFDGKNLLELDEREMQRIRGREIAWIPQSQSSLNPVLTVGFQCAEPIIQHLSYDKRSAWRKVLEIFERITEERIMRYKKIDRALRFCVKNNILFVDPVERIVKPQSQLDLLAVCKVLEELKE